ncbi:MAG TPA: LysE family translocator [Thermoleophilaceae bacterium]|nr:LysE family translocator [Thermoleophilaceae bacterium]
MPDTQTIWLFCLAAAALIVIPGPAVLYVVAQSVGQGRKAGLVSASGVASGGLVHVLAAAVGLSGLLLSSATLFSVVKFAGAAYLIYLGARRLLGLEESALVAPGEARSRRRLYRDGAVVNILNPKTALFFYAFLPQFLDPDRGAVALQALVLGTLFVAIALLSDSVWALASGSAADWLKARPIAVKIERWVSGTVLVGLGAAAALTSAHRAK